MDSSNVTKLKSRLIAGVGGASLLLLASGGLAAPQLVLVNAKVFTANPALPYAQAVAIEDGRILAVDSNERVRALIGPKTRIIDVGGRLVTPGLIEAHVHLGNELPTAPLAMPNLPFPGPTGEQALAAVEQASKTRTDWICAYIGPLVARDQRNWRKALDVVAPNTPVFLKGFWGHTSIVNSEGLRRLGITESIADPLGGWWGRDENGRLDGRAYEAAETITPRIRPLTPEYLATAFGAAQQRYARWGVTSIHLMNNDKSLEVTLAGLAAAKPAQKWTVYSWGAWQTPAERIPDAWTVIDTAAKQAPAKVRVEGPKWMLDGTPIEQNSLSAQSLRQQARLARPIEPHRCATTRDFKARPGTPDATRAARRRRCRDRPVADDDGTACAGLCLAGQARSDRAWRRHPTGHDRESGAVRPRRDPEPYAPRIADAR